MFRLSGRHTSHEHIIVMMFLNYFSRLWDFSHWNSHHISIISLSFLQPYLCILFPEADTCSTGPGCWRVILWPDSLIRSGSCWHERWESPWAVVYPTFVEEERQNLYGQAETYRANASAVLLLGLPVGLNCFSSWLEGWMLQENSLSLCHAWHQIGYYANKLMSVGYFCSADGAGWGKKAKTSCKWKVWLLDITVKGKTNKSKAMIGSSVI